MKHLPTLLLLCVTATSWSTSASAEPAGVIGRPVPEFSAYDHNGNLFSLADQTGRILVIHVCAGWCNPCQELARNHTAITAQLDQSWGAGTYELVDLLIEEAYGQPTKQNFAQTWKTSLATPARVLHMTGASGVQNVVEFITDPNAGRFDMPTNLVVDPNGKVVGVVQFDGDPIAFATDVKQCLQTNVLTDGPGCVSWGAGSIDCFAPDTNGQLVHKWYDGYRGWSRWETFADRVTSAPSVTSWGPGRLDVFARGENEDLIHKWHDRGWKGSESLGGELSSAPACVAWDQGRIDCFATSPNGQLVHKWYGGGRGWSDWESLSGTITSAPAVSSWGPGRLDVFARGAAGQLLHKFYERGWKDWQDLGGDLASAPGCVSWDKGRIDCFARSTDNQLIHKWYSKGRGWSRWEAFDSSITSAPTATSWAPGRIDVFARGSNGQLVHKWYDRGWKDWEHLGGSLSNVAISPFADN